MAAVQTRRKEGRVKRLTPESALKKLVLDYLAAKRIHVRRNQVGMMDVGGRKVPFGEKGEADCTAYVPLGSGSFGRTLFRILHLEFKAPKGKQSQAQISWQRDAELRGEHYLLVRDLDEVIAWIDRHA
jgi:hypothetical protein